ncbi:cbb3-type cytochrome c oxidase subunit 3 [Yoonia sp. 2307UL14-13]|uniref:cbb3-type cytochrome c oxidase subunit 3 n=1 Tax=Yoonia sp. 2307UL14-13 TaxID=3126506 RepID=UPI0030A81DCA
MDTYSLLREIADSWVLLALFLFFIGTILWAFRPGSGKVHKDIADIPFRNEEKPGCSNKCDNCACASFKIEELQP